MVPPVPIPMTRSVTRPSVCSQISGPVLSLVGLWIVRVVILIRQDGIGCLAGQAALPPRSRNADRPGRRRSA